MGPDGKRKLRLRHKTNAELFSAYEDQLVLKHRSKDAMEEAKRVLRHFHDFLGEFPPSVELATSFLAQFASRKPTTLYRYHSIIQGFMAWYGEKLDTKIKVPETLPEYIELDQVEKVKEALAQNRTHKEVIERNILLIELGSKTGLRRAELANLKVGDINIERQYLLVRQGKGMKDRIVDLTPSLVKSLALYLNGKNPEESLFGLKPSTISSIVHRAALKAGVNLHTHSLRDRFAEQLVDSGTDLEIVRRLMGHSSLRNTQRYLGRTDKQRRDAVLRLESPVVGNEDKTKMLPAALVPIQSQNVIQKPNSIGVKERPPLAPFLAKLHEKHRMDMLNLVRRWRAELSTQVWPQTIVELDRPGLHRSEEGLAWVVGDEGPFLKLPVTLDSDRETNLKWKCLCEHFKRSDCSYLLETLGEWQKSGGVEIENRVRLAKWAVMTVKNLIDKWPGWGTVRNARGELTGLFGTTLVAAVVDGFCADYPPVGEPDAGVYVGHCGAFRIGTATSQTGASALQRAHSLLSTFLKGDPVTQETEKLLLDAILAAESPPNIGAIKDTKAKREAIAKVMEKGLVELSVIGVVPGICRFCPH